MFGKFCIFVLFVVLYVYVAEFFLIVIRNIGMGVVIVVLRFGGILCLFVVFMGE